MSNTNPFVHEYKVDLRKGSTMERERKPLAQGDAYADKIVVHVYDNGVAVNLFGVGVSAKAVRYDGVTVPLVGSVEDGAACVVLDKACYAAAGDVRVSVAISAGDMVQTVLVLLLNVETGETGIVADNGVVGDLTSLLAEIANMREATNAALDAAKRVDEAAPPIVDSI